MEKISIIIPCYNVEKYIMECLDSIINQTIGLECLEIILVDDVSTDNTVSILKEYEAKYPEQIMVIMCEKNGRQGTARNIGLSYASGKYISFVDSDDWIHRDMYRCLLNTMKQTDSDIVQFRYTWDKEAVKSIDVNKLKYKVYDYSDADLRRQYILNSNILNESCTTKFYKRDIIDAAGVSYAEGVSYEEPLFTYPLKFFVKKVAVMEAPFYFYRYNISGTTVGHMNKMNTLAEHLYVQTETHYFMMQTPFFGEYREEIELYFLRTFFEEPFYFSKARDFDITPELFRYMCEGVENIVPEYKDNKYLNSVMLKEERELLSLIERLKGLDDKALKEALGKVCKELKKQ